MRKLLAVLLALCLAIPCAFAEEDSAWDPGPRQYFSGYYAYFLLEDGTAEISGYAGREKVLDVPDSLEGIPVTGIGEKAFADCDFLEEVTIPDGVTYIGNEAFIDCECLTGITLPDSVTSIGDRAFSHCDCLAGIRIPAGVTGIGDETFDCCSSLAGITLPEGLTKIGDNAF